MTEETNSNENDLKQKLDQVIHNPNPPDPDYEIIRKAIAMHHGGFDNANRYQIFLMWTSLDEETQKRYLADLETQTIHTRKEPDAASTRTV